MLKLDSTTKHFINLLLKRERIEVSARLALYQ